MYKTLKAIVIFLICLSAALRDAGAQATQVLSDFVKASDKLTSKDNSLCISIVTGRSSWKFIDYFHDKKSFAKIFRFLSKI